ncbi:MAG: hypothetical protein HIU81_02905 [Acidobacteria bacterium]|nr:hypothetical protein [Acidobacteriota bacterium]
MDSNTVNDLLVVSGTLIIAALIFGFIILSFLGALLLAGVARVAQLGSHKLAHSVDRPWGGFHYHAKSNVDAEPTTNAIPLT